MDDEVIHEHALSLGRMLELTGLRLATAESCTGGWIGKAMTDVAGSSQWFDCGFITYSNNAKQRLLGISPDLFKSHGAVSEPVVRAMAEGALGQSEADLAVAVSGIAGPDGGSADKPVGLVWFAWSRRGRETRSEHVHFDGNRDAVRRATVLHAMDGLRPLILDA
ncbi:MAG: CinA family protein [Aquisalimonadaceae bacterium]